MQKIKILIIEDAKTQTIKLKSLLESAGYKVIEDDDILKEALKVNSTGYTVKPYIDGHLRREIRLTSLHYGLDGDKAVTDIGNGYMFNHNEKNLYYCNKIIKLTKQELTLMQLLIQNIGQVVTMETVEIMLWYDKAVSQSSRRQLIFRLKAKLQGLNIETINGVGYKLHKE